MDLLLTNAVIFDGSRRPRRRGDVRVSDGRVVEVGDRLDRTGAEVVDLDGLCLSPGFCDIHTHLDAQVFWDPGLTPCSWHGTTSVVVGNCGLGVAPVAPGAQGAVIANLSEVEAIPAATLEAGVPWEAFSTYPQYLDAIAALPRQINVGGLVGHNPVRVFVMGEQASERAATDEEILKMRAVVREAMLAGALGFSTSNCPAHVSADGRPVPSRFASKDEVYALCGELADLRKGLIEMAVGTGWFIEEFAELSRRTQRPVSWAGLTTESDYEGITGAEAVFRSAAAERGKYLSLVDDTQYLGGQVFPQVGPRPISFRMRLSDPFLFASTPGFDQVMVKTSTEERAAVYRDAGWREKVRALAHRTVGSFGKIRQARVEIVDGREFERLGPALDELGAQQRVDPFDLMLDIAISENLKTIFKWDVLNHDEEEVGALLTDPRTLVGLSDAGAHLDQICDSSYPTYLLGHWVREKGLLPLETAIWRLTGQPASVYGIKERGFIRPGYVADLVAFDPETVAPCDIERVQDFPGGATRLIAESRGIQHMWVGGIPIRQDGTVLPENRPGTVLRG